MFKHKGIYLTIFWSKISYSFSYSFTAFQNPKLYFSSSIDGWRNCYHLRKTTRRLLLFAVFERSFNWVETIRYWWARFRTKKESVPTNRRWLSRSSIRFFHKKFEDFDRQIYFEVLGYLLMQSKVGSSKRITNTTSYLKVNYWSVLKTKVTRVSLKPFSTITQNSRESNFRKNLNSFPLHVAKSTKVKDFPSLLGVVR